MKKTKHKSIFKTKKNLLVVLMTIASIAFVFGYYVLIQNVTEKTTSYQSEASEVGEENTAHICHAVITDCRKFVSSIANDCRGKGTYNMFNMYCQNQKKANRNVCPLEIKLKNDRCITAERAAAIAQKICCDTEKLATQCTNGTDPIRLSEKDVSSLEEALPTLAPRSGVVYDGYNQDQKCVRP